MQELPILTNVARKILHCCAYDLNDMRKFDSELYPHMIYSYFVGNVHNPLSKVEIDDCILYLEEIGLLRDVERNSYGKIHSFRLSHKGFYYFDLEKMLEKQHIIELLCNSFLLPVVVSIITTILTLLISA